MFSPSDPPALWDTMWCACHSLPSILFAGSSALLHRPMWFGHVGRVHSHLPPALCQAALMTFWGKLTIPPPLASNQGPRNAVLPIIMVLSFQCSQPLTFDNTIMNNTMQAPFVKRGYLPLHHCAASLHHSRCLDFTQSGPRGRAVPGICRTADCSNRSRRTDPLSPPECTRRTCGSRG